MFSLMGALSTILFMPPFGVAIARVSSVVPGLAFSLFSELVTSAPRDSINLVHVAGL
jgi:hypothetical protein